MKTADILEFTIALSMCKSTISSTFCHMLLLWYFHFLIHFLTSPLDFPLHMQIGKFWVWNDGEKKGEGVKISKSDLWPIVLEIADLHVSRAVINSKISTIFILSTVEVFLYTNFGRGVALKRLKAIQSIETSSFKKKTEKTTELRNFCRWLAGGGSNLFLNLFGGNSLGFCITF